MVEAIVGAGFLSGFSVENGINGCSIIISHLLFADDSSILETHNGQIQALRVFLVCFEIVSGLKVNIGKSEMVQWLWCVVLIA